MASWVGATWHRCGTEGRVMTRLLQTFSACACCLVLVVCVQQLADREVWRPLLGLLGAGLVASGVWSREGRRGELER